MLQSAFNLIKRAVLGRSAPPGQDQPPAATARQDRADTVLAMQGDVRRLQHDVKDASDARDGAGPGPGRAAGEDRVAALEAELEQKQRDLARLQGPV